jgi:hypothetical protein
MEQLMVSYRGLLRSSARSLKFAIFPALVLGAMSAQSAWAGAPIKDMVATNPSMADSIYSRFSVSNLPRKPVTGGYALAPMPNQDTYAPRIVEQQGPEVSPSILGGKSNSYRGEGFVSGSTPQVTQQPRRMPLPGISVKMPLY